MRYCSIALFLVLGCVAFSQCNPLSVKKDLEYVDNTENKTSEDKVKVSGLKEIKPDDNTEKEIVVSKDNIVPLLRTIILALTHKKNPTYNEIFKVSGKALFKLAEKKVGNDKYMKNLLYIIKKYAENYTPESVNEEEEEILGELAERYLQKHKFRMLYPESLLLHQPEMETFVKKMKTNGQFEGRQMAFQFDSLIKQVTNFTANMRSTLQELPMFENLSLENIEKSFSTISTRIDGLIPTIRDAGLSGLGALSFGSVTALAAAGALISAPFFLSSFRSNFREEEDGFNVNRRVSTGGFPPEQFVGNVDGKPIIMGQPEWMNNYEKGHIGHNRVYAPKTNPHYSEPSFSLHAIKSQGETPPPNTEDEEYSKYLNDYNQWLEQYHNALNLEPNDSQEYRDYYQKYKAWYAQYYNEQFGEAPPDYENVAPSAYEENNSISNMLPPPQPEFGNIPVVDNIPVSENFRPKYDNYYNEPQQSNIQNVAPQIIQPSYQISNENAEESTNFQVFRMGSSNVKEKQKEIAVSTEQLPTASPLISNSQIMAVDNNNVYYHRANPRPVYIPNDEQFQPVTQKVLTPSVIVFKKHQEREEMFPQGSQRLPTNKVSSIKTNEFSSLEPETMLKKPEIKVVNAIIQEREKPRTVPKSNKAVKDENKIPDKKQSLSKETISYVTSGIFKTSPQMTPKAETTPRPYYKAPKNQSVRVVTSTSVVTSGPFLKKPQDKIAKRKITLTELLQQNGKKFSSNESSKKEQEEPKIEKRKDININDILDEMSVKEDKLSQRISSYGDELPVYALDPFYGPRLSRTDAIFHQLSLRDENCREQVVCNMYKNPNAFTPLSDFLSRQLTVTYDQLTRPTVNDERVLRFFKYLRAARAGQDGFNCVKEYPKCYTDTTNLSYKPIVNAYNKVSLLMNASG